MRKSKLQRSRPGRARDFDRYQTCTKIIRSPSSNTNRPLQPNRRPKTAGHPGGTEKQARQQTHAVTVQSGATAAQIGAADATIHQRQVDIGNVAQPFLYCRDGSARRICRKISVQPGQFVQAGQPAFSVCTVTAAGSSPISGKTQLDKMKKVSGS